MKSARPSRPLPAPSARLIARPLMPPSRTLARPMRAETVAEAAGRSPRSPPLAKSPDRMVRALSCRGDSCIGASVAALGRTGWLIRDPRLLLGIRAWSLVDALVLQVSLLLGHPRLVVL